MLATISASHYTLMGIVLIFNIHFNIHLCDLFFIMNDIDIYRQMGYFGPTLRHLFIYTRNVQLTYSEY